LESSNEGQSLVEFLLMLPLTLGLTVILVRVNTVIQTSIVNQQYARAQAFMISQNSPVFPRRELRNSAALAAGWNSMTVGVSETRPPSASDLEGGGDEGFQPDAPQYLIARTRAKAGPEPEAQSEPDTLGKVRIRNTFTICTQANVFQGQYGWVPLSDMAESVGAQALGASFCRGQDNE